MSLSSLEKKISKLIEPALGSATPGVQIQIHQAGKKICDLAVGETFPYYDLASLTKIIFTVQVMMKAFEEGKWNLQTKVQEICPWFLSSQVLITDCLTHTSGLAWWLPLYQQLDLTSSRLNRWTESARILQNQKLDSPDKSVYSDLGFILLGHVIENFYSLPLLDIWEKLKAENFQATTLEFHPENIAKSAAKYYAPTENCLWRKRRIQGEVHDDNAWALGGVSTHAGLFGSIDDLGWFGLCLRSQLKGLSRTMVKIRTAKLFSTRALPFERGDWAMGFMMPTMGGSSSGQYFSAESVGHTGFTGTSFWYDPIQDLSVGILSNRVFYGRENKQFAALRPQIHNGIMEALKRI